MAKKPSKPNTPIDPQSDPQANVDKESHDLFIAHDELEREEAADVDVDEQLATQEKFDTQHSDGHTHNIHQTIQQGLTYTPPTDPPILPGENPQDAEMGAGFAPGMEETQPDARRLPDAVDNSDLDLRDNVYDALRLNSETGHLDLADIKVGVHEGVVSIMGTVMTRDDIALVDAVIRDLDGVVDLHNQLTVALE